MIPLPRELQRTFPRTLFPKVLLAIGRHSGLLKIAAAHGALATSPK
jgi:hypothetical protein